MPSFHSCRLFHWPFSRPFALINLQPRFSGPSSLPASGRYQFQYLFVETLCWNACQKPVLFRSWQRVVTPFSSQNGTTFLTCHVVQFWLEDAFTTRCREPNNCSGPATGLLTSVRVFHWQIYCRVNIDLQSAEMNIVSAAVKILSCKYRILSLSITAENSTPCHGRDVYWAWKMFKQRKCTRLTFVAACRTINIVWKNSVGVAVGFWIVTNLGLSFSLHGDYFIFDVSVLSKYAWFGDAYRLILLLSQVDWFIALQMTSQVYQCVRNSWSEDEFFDARNLGKIALKNSFFFELNIGHRT